MDMETEDLFYLHHDNGAITPGLLSNPRNGITDIDGLLY